VGDDVFGDVDVDLAQGSRTGIEKFMGDIGGRDDDLSGMGDQGFLANGEGALTFLNDEDLFVGMAVQANLLPRLHIHPDERDLGVELRALKIEGAAVMR
jgi:hypothetical protein